MIHFARNASPEFQFVLVDPARVEAARDLTLTILRRQVGQRIPDTQERYADRHSAAGLQQYFRGRLDRRQEDRRLANGTWERREAVFAQVNGTMEDIALACGDRAAASNGKSARISQLAEKARRASNELEKAAVLRDQADDDLRLAGEPSSVQTIVRARSA